MMTMATPNQKDEDPYPLFGCMKYCCGDGTKNYT